MKLTVVVSLVSTVAFAAAATAATTSKKTSTYTPHYYGSGKSSSYGSQSNAGNGAYSQSRPSQQPYRGSPAMNDTSITHTKNVPDRTATTTSSCVQGWKKDHTGKCVPDWMPY